MKEYWAQMTLVEKWKFILVSVIVLIVLLFTIFNWQTVDLHLVFFELEMPLTAVIAFSLGAGYLASTLFDYSKFRKKDREIKRLRKKLRARHPELDDGEEESS
jgi:uncharacterized integral membrane protein